MGVDAALTVLIFHAAFAWGSFGAWLAISASRVVRTICRLFVINKANAAACGHKSARLHAGVMTGALSTIRNAAAVSSMRQFQLGTLQEWFAAARHCAALTCQR